jgi:hypothetical protein
MLNGRVSQIDASWQHNKALMVMVMVVRSFDPRGPMRTKALARQSRTSQNSDQTVK